MKVLTKLTEKDLTQIATELGLRLNNFRCEGRYKAFTLKHSGSVKNKTRFVRIGFQGQRINSVCLHGYTLFMLKVLEKDPNAVFKSVFGVVDEDNIEDMYHSLRGKNIGSIMSPLYYGEACLCGDDVYDEFENYLTSKI